MFFSRSGDRPDLHLSLRRQRQICLRDRHCHGHRERLRERFYAAGPDALTDYELLEMALFAAIPRRDTKPLAKALLKKFGSFAEVVHAPVARLREVEGVKDASINQLKLLAAAAGRIAKGEIRPLYPLDDCDEERGVQLGVRANVTN